MGSRGDSYDDALAETVNGLYKAELVNRQGPWRSVEQVELATAAWVHWWNTQRLISACRDVLPAEYEAAYWATRQRHPPPEPYPSGLHRNQGGSDDVRAHRRVGPEVLGLDGESDVECIREREGRDEIGTLVLRPRHDPDLRPSERRRTVATRCSKLCESIRQR